MDTQNKTQIANATNKYKNKHITQQTQLKWGGVGGKHNTIQTTQKLKQQMQIITKTNTQNHIHKYTT